MGSRPHTTEARVECPDCRKMHWTEIEYDWSVHNGILPKERCSSCQSNWDKQFRDWKQKKVKFLQELAEKARLAEKEWYLL